MFSIISETDVLVFIYLDIETSKIKKEEAVLVLSSTYRSVRIIIHLAFQNSIKKSSSFDLKNSKVEKTGLVIIVEQGKTEEIMSMAAVTPPPPPPPAGAAANLQFNPYPPPLARYEDVVTNPKLFIDTLEKLHASMGTKFMIPIIGGRDLDLHKLFVEVTTRGGIEKILREKRWKEVTAAFQFPSTATNASFVLRKYYFSLVHHYEQIYFFRALGWTPMPHASLQSGHAVPIAVHGGFRTVPPPTTVQPQVTSVASDPVQQGAPTSSVGTQVIGVIDGKFESGYLVTVTFGSQKLKGVLYQTVPQTTGPTGQAQQANNTLTSQIVNSVAPAPVRRRRRRRKKSEIKRRDPALPKPNRSGYNFFFAEQHARLKPLYRGRDREISRIIGELWTKLQESEKSVYQEKAMNDKERYKREMEGYRERLRMGQVISDAVPIQQRLPIVVDAEMAGPDPKDSATRESSEMFDDDDNDDDDNDDEYCSMSGSESEDMNATADKAAVQQQTCSVDVGLSLASGSARTEEIRAQGESRGLILDAVLDFTF
ncbi:hypothetical protein V2J09_024059 [Rumex salicifolius]